MPRPQSISPTIRQDAPATSDLFYAEALVHAGVTALGGGAPGLLAISRDFLKQILDRNPQSFRATLIDKIATARTKAGGGSPEEHRWEVTLDCMRLLPSATWVELRDITVRGSA
jgi:hypothetical protein